jgi:hypothetical protein
MSNTTYWRISDGGIHHLYPSLAVDGHAIFDPSSTAALSDAEFMEQMSVAQLIFGKSSRSTPDFLSVGTTDLVSKRLADLLSNLTPPQNLLLQPLKSTKPHCYMALRAQQIDCINTDASDITYWGNTKLIKSIRHLTFTLERLQEVNIFQPVGLQMFFVSSKLKRSIEAQELDVSLTAAEFVRLG